MADILKLNFEGIDEATTWTEEAQALTPTEVFGICVIDTSQYYTGTSSLKFSYEPTIEGEDTYTNKRIIYTVPNIEAIFECTTYFRFHDLIINYGSFYIDLLDSNNSNTLFQCGVDGNGTENVWFYAYGMDSSMSEFYVSGTEDTYYYQETTLTADTWHKLYIKVLDRDVVIEIDDVEIVTLTATIDDPLLGIDTVSFRSDNSEIDNDIWVDKILMSNGISSGSGVLEVSTQAATEVTTSGCVFNGTIDSLGLTATLERGFCYLEGAFGTPNIYDNFKTYTSGSYEVGPYSLSPEETLTSETAYRFRAYSIDDAGVVYGDTVHMITSGGEINYGPNRITGWTNAASPSNFTTLTTSGSDITSCIIDVGVPNDCWIYTNNLGLPVGSECTLTIVLTKNNMDVALDVCTSSQTGTIVEGSVPRTYLSEGTNTINFTTTVDDLFIIIVTYSWGITPDFSCTVDLRATTLLNVSTQAATDVTTSGCVFNGTINSLGMIDTLGRGFCYLVGMSGTPNVEDDFKIYESGVYEAGSYFLSPEETLIASTGYRFRAFAADNNGAVYGDTVQMTTLSSGGAPLTTDILKLNFEGTDGATTWVEEAQSLTPENVVGKCIIDTAQYFDGTSSLELNYEQTFVNELWIPEKRVVYTISNIEADFEYTVYFRFHGVDSEQLFSPIILYDTEGAAYFDVDFYDDGSDLHCWIGGTDSLDNEIGTTYDELNTFTADVWHKLYVKVLDRDIVVEVDDVEIVTLTATMDDPLLGVNTIEFNNYSSGTGNSVWLDKILMSNGVGGGSGVALPTVTTQAPTFISSSNLVFNGTVVSTGGEGVSSRGFCYMPGISGDPTIDAPNVAVFDSGPFEAGTYTKSVTGLLIATDYMIRAYAENSAGIAYGPSLHIITLPSAGILATNKVIARTSTDIDNVLGINYQYIKTINKVLWRIPDVPIVYAYSTYVTSSGITMTGVIRDTGLGNSTRRGFCYIPTSSDIPTINDSIVYEDGGSFGLGEYSMSITGLDENISYTIISFATNSAGTSYGVPIYTRTDNLFMDFAYFGTAKSSAERVVEINLSNFTKTGSRVFPDMGMGDGLEAHIAMFTTAVVDPKNRYAYLGAASVDDAHPASGEYLASEAYGNDVVGLDLLTLYSRSLKFSYGNHGVRCAVIDPSHHYAYFGLDSVPGKIVKVNLSTFTETAVLTLTGDGENHLSSAVIDDDNGFAYFGTSTAVPGRIVKIDLSTFTRVGEVHGELYHGEFTTAVIDKPNGFAYFGTYHIPGRIVKINLSNFAFVGEIELAIGEDYLKESVIDQPNGFAYFITYTNPGKIIKIRLSDFTRVDTLTLNTGEYCSSAVVIDQLRGIMYLGTAAYAPGKIIKVDLTSFTSLGSITLAESESHFSCAIIV